MTAIYLDLLNAERRKLFLKLKPLVKQGAVLAGGTALSLQIKHRYSFDVDLFFLLKDKHINLADLMKDAEQKFKPEFAAKLFLEQLTHYGDIREFKTEFAGRKYLPEQIQEFLKKEVLRYTKAELNYA